MQRLRMLVAIPATGLTLLFANVPAAYSSVYFWDGHRLKELSDAEERISRGSPQDGDITPAGALMGYVVGVGEVLDGVASCLPKGASVGQITAVVQKYLHAHPEKWNEPAKDIVSQALKQAFPCK